MPRSRPRRCDGRISLNGADRKPRLTLRYNAMDGATAILYGEDGKAFKLIEK